MCLDILESDPPNLDETGFGWKVLRREFSHYVSHIQPGYKYIPNEWTYARTHFVTYGDIQFGDVGFFRSSYLYEVKIKDRITNPAYLGGIYIYDRTVALPTINLNRISLIKEVEYQGVLARGYQNGKKVLVVHAIRVIN